MAQHANDVVDVVVVGGGPAGAAVARLLASWGRTVRVLAPPIDRARGLAESLPPSTRKLLAEIGILDAVDAAGFLRATGNTSWWASQEPRVETFDTPGYQIFRPDFDPLMLDSARRAGADVRSAIVRRVELEHDGARV
ncbi:MAG TPA: FAD-dependent monooxygenase, partial [Vicinamibacterales bacterium]|nr:FAD-dependent monooxygenase [Vicinamibacterales bacterium]